MRWAIFFISTILIVSIFSCQKDVSSHGGDSIQSGLNSSSALIDSILVKDSSDTSGIDYLDDIYDLSQAPEVNKAIPVYHSKSSTELPCKYSDSTQSTCLFDETDLDGNGIADIGGVNKSKLLINRKNGVIDLAGSFAAGVFGPTPQNGARRAFTLFYRLDDNSKRSLEQVTIQLIYYKRKSDIPQTLVNEIAARKQQYLVSTTTSSTSTRMSYAIVYKPKRPPLIVLVSSL